MPRAPAVWQQQSRALPAGLLCRLPELVVDDAKLRNLCECDIFAWVWPGDPVAGFRVTLHVDAVVGEAANVDRIVQNPDHPRPVADDRRRAPFPPAGRWDAVMVEAMRNAFRAFAGDIFAQDAAHDFGLRFVDSPPAGDMATVIVQLVGDVVAITETTRDTPTRDGAALAAPNLLREVTQEQRAHGALQADMQLVDASLRERLDPDVRESEPLVNGGDVRLIARDAIQCFRQDDVERAGGRIVEHLCHAGPLVVRTRNGEVGVDVDDLPAFSLGAVAAIADLVFGGRLRLSIG